MNLFINLSSITHPMTGIGHYTFNLLKELLESSHIQQLAGIHQCNLLDRAQIERLVDAYPAPPGKGSLNCRLRAVAGNTPFVRSAYHAYQAHAVRQQHSKLRGFLYWEPNFIALPFGGVTVTTVHDLSHLEHPELHPARRVKTLRRRLATSIAASDRIITVSNASKKEIQRHFHPACGIDIVPPGVGPAFSSVTKSQREACRRAYQLPPSFILSVATLEPRKNLARVLEAFERLPEGMKQRYPLVICGAKGWLSHPLHKKIAQLQSKRLALCLGYVAQEHLPALYASATLSVYVSQYEGFGMPVIESMAAGTPVLTSSVSALPEVAGDAALLVSPQDTSAITHALDTLLENARLRERLAGKGKQHARQFTWQRSRDRLIRAFDTALASAPTENRGG